MILYPEYDRPTLQNVILNWQACNPSQTHLPRSRKTPILKRPQTMISTSNKSLSRVGHTNKMVGMIEICLQGANMPAI